MLPSSTWIAWDGTPHGSFRRGPDSSPTTPASGSGALVSPSPRGKTAKKRAECHRHEALLNTAFTDVQFPWLLCPYDLSALDPQTVDEARRNHPFVRTNGPLRRRVPLPGLASIGSTAYQSASAASSTSSPTLDFGPEEVAEVRQFVADQAQRVGLEAAAIEDLVLAANEVATNSIRHGGGGGTVTAWQDAGWLDREFSDRGLLEPIH